MKALGILSPTTSMATPLPGTTLGKVCTVSQPQNPSFELSPDKDDLSHTTISKVIRTR